MCTDARCYIDFEFAIVQAPFQVVTKLGDKMMWNSTAQPPRLPNIPGHCREQKMQHQTMHRVNIQHAICFCQYPICYVRLYCWKAMELSVQ